MRAGRPLRSKFGVLCLSVRLKRGRLSYYGDEEAALLLNSWGTPDGGFILTDCGAGHATGVDMEKNRITLDAFPAADPWRMDA